MNNQIVTVNLIPGLSTPAVIRVSQYDVGRPLTIRVLDGTGAASFGSSVTATIVGTKPSGLGFTQSGLITGNTVTLNTTLAMTQECGMIPAEIRFTQSGENVGTANFILAVEMTPHADGTTDGTYETMADLQTQLNGLDTRVDALEAGQGGGSGLTDDVKTALLNCFAHVAWVDADGQDYYDALESALDSGDLSVSLMLSQVSSSNTATTVGYGESYTTTLTASTGYTLNTVSVTMGGVDITSTAYSSGTVSIPSVTGNIVITATAVQTAYLVTNNLTNVINSNGATTIPINGSYSASLTASSQQGQIQSVTITMGGIDITSTAYSDGTITIASVTGDIVITATAYLARYNTSDGNITIVNGGWEALNAISGELLSNTANQNSRRSLYVDSGQKAVYRGTQSSYSLSTYYPIPVPSGATSVTVSCDKPAHYNAIGLEKLTADGYTGIAYHDFSAGSATLEFEADSDLYIMTNSKRANGYNYNTDDPAPSEFTVLFS